MYLRKTLAFLRGMWYHQVVFGRVPLLGMGSGGAKSRFLQLRGYSTVGSAIRSQRIGCGGVRGRSPKLHRGDPFRGVGGISLSAARRQIAWGYSTVGSAIRSQRIGHEFESRYLHHVAARRILKQLELAQAVFVYASASRVVETALGQEMARTMHHFQVRKWPKPHCGFAKKALAHPFPTNLLLTQNLCGSPEE